MEEGSLLQQVLEDVQSRRDRQAHEVASFWSENILLIDVFVCCAPDNNNNNNNNYYNNATKETLLPRIDDPSHHRLLLLHLAQLARELNDYIRGFSYPWHVGGDGVVFGIHTTHSIPHLRGACYYGANVVDEWMAIAMMKRWSAQRLLLHQQQQQKQHQHHNKQQIEDVVAMQFWDVQDGHVLLIQTADVLPEWVDRIGPQACRYRCWMVNGQVVLLAPNQNRSSISTTSTTTKNLSLTEAFQTLCQWCSSATTVVADNNVCVSRPQAVQEALHEYLQPLEQDLEQSLVITSASEPHNKEYHTQTTLPQLAFAAHLQRTAVLLPRSVASLAAQRPELINTLVVMFQQLAESQVNIVSSIPTWKKRDNDEDWVWTKMRVSKTNYAMLRTIDTALWPVISDGVESSSSSSSSIPAPYQTTETLEWQRRLSQQHEYRHVSHALQLGIRLTAGMDYILHMHQLLVRMEPKSSSSSPSSLPSTTVESLMEARIQQHWARIHRECCGKGDVFPSDKDAMDSIRNCPVYDPELLLVSTPSPSPNKGTNLPNLSNVFNPCPLTRPGEPLAVQITLALKNQTTNVDAGAPGPEDVDDEESWLVLSEKEGRALEEAYRTQSFASPFSLFHRKQPAQPQPSSAREKDVVKSTPPEGDTDQQQQQLDEMLDSFKTFMTKPSELEGIDTRSAPVEQPEEESQRVGIQPRVFLNLLHAVLQASDPDDLNLPVVKGNMKSDPSLPTNNYSISDPYFSDDDYDMAGSSDDDNDEFDMNEGGPSLKDIMVSRRCCLMKLT